jgi:hypothetical protein
LSVEPHFPSNKSLLEKEERERTWKVDPRTSWMSIGIRDTVFENDARETVKKRWIEQGI